MSGYEIASWVVFSLLIFMLVIYFPREKDSHREFCLIVSLMIVFLVALAALWTVDINHEDNIAQQKLCEAYCDCQITQDCDYTFDYKDVENCNCEEE